MKLKASSQITFLINAVGFQLCWLACVIGGNLWAVITTILFLFWHRFIMKKGEWRLIIITIILGITMDHLWYHLQFISFPNHTGLLIPLWLAALWVCFSTTLWHSLSVLYKRPWLISLLTAVAAPLSYFAGSSIGSIQITPLGYLSISAGWAVLMFLLASIFPNSYSNASETPIEELETPP